MQKSKIKIGLLVAAVALIAAGCANPFSTPSVAGFLKTANGGADWQSDNAVKDNPKLSMSGLSISAMAFDPIKPERIFASSYDSGVFLSEDGGDTWKRILDKFLVYDIAIHPQNPGVIYAAGSYAGHGRLVVTRDGGKSWTEIFNEASSGNAVRTIALNPTNPAEVVIGLNAGSIIKSQDSGVTWRQVQNYNGRINKLRWKQSYLYAVIRESGVYRSTDGGNSFTSLTSSVTPTNNIASLLISSSEIGNFNQVAISDNSPDVMFITTDIGLYRTFNGGSSWEYVALPLKKKSVQTLAVSIAPSSDNIVYASAGATVYRSSDGGSTWQTQDTRTDGGQVNIILINPMLPQIAYAGIYGQQ